MLTLLRKIVESVSQTEDLTEFMKRLVTKTKVSLNVDCCSVYLAEPEQNRFLLVASDGLRDEAVGKITIPFNDGLVGLIGRKLELINLADAPIHPNFKYIPEVGEDCFRSFLGVPIVEQRNLLGVMVIQQKTSRKFDESDESFMVMLASQLAGKIFQAKTLGKSSPNKLPVGFIKGIGASKGEAYAKAFVWHPQLDLEQIVLTKTDDVEMQLELFHQAIFQVQLDLDALMIKLNKTTSNNKSSEIFDIYSMILNDQSFINEIAQEILSNNLMASSAVKIVCERYIKNLSEKDDSSLQDRYLDIKDVSQRLLSKLAHHQVEVFDFSEPIILLAEEVSASLLAEIPLTSLKGVVSLSGSVNSQAAILARSLGIPAVMGINIPINKLSNKTIIVDGNHGGVIVEPDVAVISEYEQIINTEQNLQKLADEELAKPAISLDGEKFSIQLNAGIKFSTYKQEQAVNNFVDGIGLYRSEIPFMLQDNFPSETKQTNYYRDFLMAFKSVPVTMRTLDVGGDKSLSYFHIDESNPALGWRGVRLTLDLQNIMLTQLKAMLKASMGLDNLSIMIPMVSSVSEVKEVKKLLDVAYQEIAENAYDDGHALQYPKLGAMIEVPSVLFLLDELSEYVDFFSIGTNDLTQYMLAVDRSNPKVAPLYDSYHPSVLKAMKKVCLDCANLHKPVAVCGEMAGDFFGVLILLSFGFRTFSMNYGSVAKVKYLLRRIDVTKITEIVNEIGLSNIKELKQKIFLYLKACNLSDLVSSEVNTN